MKVQCNPFHFSVILHIETSHFIGTETGFLYEMQQSVKMAQFKTEFEDSIKYFSMFVIQLLGFMFKVNSKDTNATSMEFVPASLLLTLSRY